MPFPHVRRDSLRRGFTIVELLVTIGIISVLVGILLPALKGARGAAERTEEASAGRQLAMAWQQYAMNNKDQVLPGYKTGLSARNQEGEPITSPITAARYPWRLAPYFGYDFRGMYTNANREELERLEQDPIYYEYRVSLTPSLGLNSTWVGGDENHLGFNSTYTDVYGQFYVKTISQIYHPDRLLLFASARGGDPNDPEFPPSEGYFRVESPWLTASGGDRWDAEYRDTLPPSSFGFMSFRHAGQAVTVFTDHHTEVMGPRPLRDMRHWANRAESSSYALEPIE